MIKVVMMMAMTLDGKIAKNEKHFAGWTSKEDKKLFSEISKKHGVVMMGENTFNTFPAPLKERLNVVFTLRKNPAEMKGVKWVSGDVEKVLEDLEKMGYQSALLGGGAYLNALFLKKKLIDEMIITVEPKIFGKGLSLFRDEEFDVNLHLKEMKKINDNAIMLHYLVEY